MYCPDFWSRFNFFIVKNKTNIFPTPKMAFGRALVVPHHPQEERQRGAVGPWVSLTSLIRFKPRICDLEGGGAAMGSSDIIVLKPSWEAFFSFVKKSSSSECGNPTFQT